MANTLIPVNDVCNAFLQDAHKAMRNHFPDLNPGSQEYKETMSNALVYAFGGLFCGPKHTCKCDNV